MIKTDSTTIILVALLISYTILLFIAAIIFPKDQQVFTIMSGLIGGFSGAFLARIKFHPPSPGKGDENED